MFVKGKYLQGKISFFDQRTITWDDESNTVLLIDQTLLPEQLIFIRCKTPMDVVNAIKTMKIRGAPAIGVAGAMGVALSVNNSHALTKEELFREIEADCDSLRSARPTAVNLSWGVNTVVSYIKSDLPQTLNEETKNLVIAFVKKLADKDVQTNKQLSDYGAKLFRKHDTVLTHCNAGALATVGYGTALGVVRSVVNQGKQVKVFAAEARPVLQGARLTAFELVNDGIDVTLVPDTAIGISMQRGLIDRVVVGADRITKTGHVFNKVGTYQIATLAKRHGIPFYVAAPLSTFDFQTDWRKVKIEERSGEEVKRVRGVQTAPESVKVFNPAFDVTPPELITGIICEIGVLTKPLASKIKRLKRMARKINSMGP